MNQTPLIIGIAGPSGSGKTCLANTIVNEIGSDHVVVISEDAYYKDLGDMPMAVKAKMNFDHPDSFDHSLLISHLIELQAGNPVDVPQYDFSTHSRLSESRKIGQHKIIVLEGILLFSDAELRRLMDIRIYVDTPLDICFIRRLERDVAKRKRSMESVIAQYQETVRPMYLQFVDPSKRYADIIVPHGGKNRIAIDMIKAQMNNFIG